LVLRMFSYLRKFSRTPMNNIVDLREGCWVFLPVEPTTLFFFLSPICSIFREGISRGNFFDVFTGVFPFLLFPPPPLAFVIFPFVTLIPVVLIRASYTVLWAQVLFIPALLLNSRAFPFPVLHPNTLSHVPFFSKDLRFLRQLEGAAPRRNSLGRFPCPVGFFPRCRAVHPL